jgi:hypothetical protein
MMTVSNRRSQKVLLRSKADAWGHNADHFICIPVEAEHMSTG